MYKRNAQGWSKHFDFMLIDEIALQLAYILAVWIWLGAWAYGSIIYRTMGVLLVIMDALAMIINNTMHNVTKRGYYKEFAATAKNCLTVFGSVAVFLFAVKSGSTYSRVTLFMAFLLYGLLSYGTRLLWKALIRRWGLISRSKSKMLVVAPFGRIQDVLDRLDADPLIGHQISGVILTDRDDLREIAGYPVVSDMEGAADYLVREWVDSVYVDAPLTDEKLIRLMDDCVLMAIPTHYYVPLAGRSDVKRFSERIAGTTVLTTSINYATPMQALMKRCFDIFAGIIGSLAALLIMAIVGPKIKKESPGPILYRSERIGMNGKRFKMIKIRSMYLDADARKASLMEKNRVRDGMMFKLDFDPRIIGNVELPDGTRRTGIGEFIRRTSLDEFPQFFNVLKGDMSVVGTRPPTPDEWEKYRYHHRARLACKPGITGMWQVSGRSDITDFEEVVRLDTEYIHNWSMGMDLRILLKTVRAVLKHEGAL